MVDVRPMDESYIYISCLHFGPIDPKAPIRSDWAQPQVSDLPPHPWSDGTIAELARMYRCLGEGQGGNPTREFMRDCKRYGTGNHSLLNRYWIATKAL